MESSLLVRLFDAILLAAGLLYLLLLRPWRPRRMLAGLTPSIDLLFAVGLCIGVASLHWAPPFTRLADWLVAQTELPEILAEVDARIHALETLPERTWDDLLARLGWGVESPAPPPAPPDAGVMVRSVLPAVNAVAEALLRAFVYGGSLIVLAVCQVMRLVTDVRRALRDRPRPAGRSALEARVAALEEALALSQARGGALPAADGA